MQESYTTGLEGLAQVMFKDLSLALAVGHDLKASLPAAALASQMVERVLGIKE